MQEEKTIGLPENATRELKEGEVYVPLMTADKIYPEVNFRSVRWGIIMAVLFSAAAAYLGLKIGQVFEAAIPMQLSLSACRAQQNEKTHWAKMLSFKASVRVRA